MDEEAKAKHAMGKGRSQRHPSGSALLGKPPGKGQLHVGRVSGRFIAQEAMNSTPQKDGGKAGLFSARSATGLARVKGKRENTPGRQDRAVFSPSLCAHYQHTLSTATKGHRKQCLP